MRRARGIARTLARTRVLASRGEFHSSGATRRFEREDRMSPADGRGRRSPGRSSEVKKGAKGAARTPGDPATGAKAQMTIASDYANARDVQQRVRDEVARAGFDADSQFAIKLALEEALINAIKHGNKLDKRKTVRVEWDISPAAAEIIIEDQGPGFDRKSVPDPTDEPNLEKLTGRGILLIESYMTDVQWSNGGRRVKLVKKNDRRTPGVKTA
jgi:serine/threonine-protein kinase RsbW